MQHKILSRAMSLSPFNLFLNKVLQLWIKCRFSNHRQQEEQHLHIFHPLIHSFKKYLLIITFKWFFNFRTMSLILHSLIMHEEETNWISSCIHFNKSLFFLTHCVSFHTGQYRDIMIRKIRCFIVLTVWRKKLTLIKIHTYACSLQLSLRLQQRDTSWMLMISLYDDDTYDDKNWSQQMNLLSFLKLSFASNSLWWTLKKIEALS